MISLAGGGSRSLATAILASLWLMACSSTRDEPTNAVPPNQPNLNRDRGAGSEESAPHTGAPRAPSGLVVEGSIPEPAVWIDANRDRACAVAWLNETDRVTWTNEGLVAIRSAHPGELVRRREKSYRRLPRGPWVRCEVTDRGELRCGYHRCMNPAIFAGTQPPRPCRSESPVYASARASEMQRTEEFTPERPWWLHGPIPPLQRMQSSAERFACVRVEGRVRCYPVRRGDRIPSPVRSPELDALGDVIDLAGAGSTACAVRGDGTVFCWGAPLSNTHEAGTTLDRARWWIPRRINGLPSAVVQVSVGETRACVRTHDGRVFCWGDVGCMTSSR